MNCKDCPHVIGDITERDCCFPDCVGGWESVYKSLQADNERLRESIRNAMNELGVPQPGYAQPVANAYYILKEALDHD
jgi:hypothetical protein